jgi:AcrR family transcriptional regulator
MQATERAMREAALRLMSERGYDATSTDDIARAAGVSPRTFFNYFASKDAVVLLPEGIFLDLVTSALDARPAGEDPTAAVAAAIMGAFHHFDLLIGPDAAELMRAQLRLMFAVPEVRRITFDRRLKVEEVVWDRLRAHGVAAEDLSARAAVATVMSLAFLGLTLWASSDDDEPLLGVIARCLLAAPHPSRLAAGVTAAPLVS